MLELSLSAEPGLLFTNGALCSLILRSLRANIMNVSSDAGELSKLIGDTFIYDVEREKLARITSIFLTGRKKQCKKV